jgi:tetratricopeptide (TPR) repeat protein
MKSRRVDTSRALEKGKPTVRTIEHSPMMPTGPRSAGWCSGDAGLAALATSAILVLFATCATAQIKEPAKSVPEAPKSAGELTPSERDRLLKEFRELESQAAQNYRQNRVEEATTCVKRALQVLERVYPKTKFPDGHLDVSEMLGKLAMMEISAGKVPEALDRFRQSFAMTSKVAGRGDPHREAILLFLAEKCSESAELLVGVSGFEDAARLYRLAIEAAESIDPDLPTPRGDLLLASAWLGLTDALRRQNKLAEQETAWRKLIDVLNRRGQRLPDQQGEILLATAFNDLGLTLLQQRKDAEAVLAFQKALEIWRRLYPEKTHPEGHPEILNTLAALGKGYAELNQLARAESFYRESVAMSRGLVPQDQHPDTLNGLPTTEGLLRALGRVLTLRGRLVEAEACLRESLAVARATYPAATHPNGHPAIAESLKELGRALCKLRKLDEAESVERNALSIIGLLEPAADQFTAEILGELGGVVRDKGKLNEAETILRRALELAVRQNAAAGDVRGNSGAARIIAAIAGVHEARGDYAIAKRKYLQALERAASAADRAQICDQIAAVLIRLGEKERAGAYALAAIQIRTELYPPDDYPRGHPDLATSLVRLAQIGGMEQAADRYRGALEMFQALLPEKEYPRGSVAYSDCLWELGQWRLRRDRYRDPFCDTKQAEDYCRRSVRMPKVSSRRNNTRMATPCWPNVSARRALFSPMQGEVTRHWSMDIGDWRCANDCSRTRPIRPDTLCLPKHFTMSGSFT